MTRLSKLQKWILNRCLEEHKVWRDGTREYFGKKFGEHLNFIREAIDDSHHEGVAVLKGRDVNDYTIGICRNGLGEEWPCYYPKEELRSTRAIEASISRSFGGLVKQGFLTERGHFGECFLTEKGFLSVNKTKNSRTVNTYNQYVEAVNAENAEIAEHFKNLIKDLKKIRTP